MFFLIFILFFLFLISCYFRFGPIHQKILSFFLFIFFMVFRIDSYSIFVGRMALINWNVVEMSRVECQTIWNFPSKFKSFIIRRGRGMESECLLVCVVIQLDICIENRLPATFVIWIISYFEIGLSKPRFALLVFIFRPISSVFLTCSLSSWHFYFPAVAVSIAFYLIWINAHNKDNEDNHKCKCTKHIHSENDKKKIHGFNSHFVSDCYFNI